MSTSENFRKRTLFHWASRPRPTLALCNIYFSQIEFDIINGPRQDLNCRTWGLSRFESSDSTILHVLKTLFCSKKYVFCVKGPAVIPLTSHLLLCSRSGAPHLHLKPISFRSWKTHTPQPGLGSSESYQTRRSSRTSSNAPSARSWTPGPSVKSGRRRFRHQNCFAWNKCLWRHR